MTPKRVVRRRHGLLASLAAVLFLASLLGAERRDDGWLITIGGAAHDLRGRLQAAWQDAWRDCSRVERVPASAVLEAPGQVPQAHTSPAAFPTPTAQAALAALREFSPPDSASARLLAADVWRAPSGTEPTWVLLQARFDVLEPVVVLVRVPSPSDAAQVVPPGVWSGTTLPWHPAWRIRGFLAQRVPEAPASVLACLDPDPVFSQPPRPS